MEGKKAEVWRELKQHWEKTKDVHMRDLFERDPNRFEKFSMTLFNGDLMLDYSKNRITEETMRLLMQLVEESGIREKIKDMFSGKEINYTEKRPVLHVALRNRSNTSIKVQNQDVMPQINQVLDQMESFVNSIHNGTFKGYSGKVIKNVVNIGIGGSDLGPLMIIQALRPYWISSITCHFVSNVDGSHLSSVLSNPLIDPESTLFIIASKTFTTQETILNANSAKSWILSHYNHKSSNQKSSSNSDQNQSSQIISRHFIALSTSSKLVSEFGIASEHMFPFWDYVGGRFSLWSAIGLSIAIQIGFPNFVELLSGAHDMDQHFSSTVNLREDVPVILALLTVWYSNFYGCETHAVLPYDQNLHRLPAYLQQLEMESNGKRVNKQSKDIQSSYNTGVVIWGEAGTNGQHAFYQLLHQGTRLIPCDFIGALNPVLKTSAKQAQNEENDIKKRHFVVLMSNYFAQMEALMKGKKEKVLERNFEGNVPSNGLLWKEMSVRNVGRMVAMYEHKIFVEGIVWEVNSWDQFGVELGKVLAKKVLEELEDEKVEKVAGHDSSTNGMMNWWKKNHKKCKL